VSVTALPTRVPPAVLGSIAAGLAAVTGPDDLVLEPGQDRAYSRLLLTDAYEAWLIAWAPGGALDLHDHGGSGGAVVVVEGELRERFTDRERPGPLCTNRIRAGEPLAIGPDRVHGVWNPGPATAVSVHVYSPPLTTMTFYDPALLTSLHTERAAVG
jgi:predicted metal-dependent enzyme (double-stranded beta helix superfamily)